MLVQIYAVDGRAIRRLQDAYQQGGRYRISWDGTDDRGVAVSSGAYLSKVRLESRSVVEKMLLLK